MPESGLSSPVKQLHRRSIVIDAHNDTVLNLIEEGPFITDSRGKLSKSGQEKRFLQPSTTLSEDSERGEIDLPKIEEGGLDCLIFSCWVSPTYENPLSRLMQYLDTLHRELRETEGIELATNYSELEDILQSSQVAALISVEGGVPLNQQTSALRMINKLGVSSLTFTHFDRNALGDGSGSDFESRLTDFGREVVEEMNRLGMIIDLAHFNRKGFYDALEESEDPVIVSHANVDGVTPHHRNLTDRQLRKLAEAGGVLGLSLVPNFIKDVDNRTEVTLADFLDHVDHIRDLIGTDHIGLGSDFDGGAGFPEVSDVRDFPKITEGLLSRGYSDGDIEKILGGNLLRVFEEVLP